MKQGDFLFVYGTLRRGERMSLEENRMVLFRNETRINGLMYHLGGFPGVTFDPAPFDPGLPTVDGDLFFIRDTSITPILDAYEGYPTLYGRTCTITECNRKAWVYFYKGDVSMREPLKSGDWRTGKLATLEMPTGGRMQSRPRRKRLSVLIGG